MLVTEPNRARIIGLGTWLLGLLFLAAASLKALEFNTFVGQIERYGLLPESLASAAGIGLIAAEAVLGVFCLAGFHVGKALGGMIALLALFIAATLLRWGALAGTNCGCFGSVSAGGRGAVLLHGFVLIAFAGGLILLARKTAGAMPYRGFRLATGGIAALAITFVAQPPSASLSRVAPGEDLIRVFMSATCPKCKSETGLVRELAGSTSLAPVRLFIGAENRRQIEDFVGEAGGGLEYTPLTFHQLAREARQVPTVQLFQDGELLREWVGRVPNIEEVREALAAGGGPPAAQGRADAGRP